MLYLFKKRGWDMRKCVIKLVLFFLLLFMEVTPVLAVSSHLVGFVTNESNDMEFLESTLYSGTLVKDGYFTYQFQEDKASITLEKDAHINLLNLNKYVDDVYGFVLSKNRDIEVHVNGNNVIDLVGSTLDENMVLRVQGEGSLTIKKVMQHAENTDKYSIVAMKCKRLNEESQLYEDDIYFFVNEKGEYLSFSNMAEIEEAYYQIKIDDSLVFPETFREEDVLFFPSLAVTEEEVSKEWVEKHIITDDVVDYNNDGSITIRKPV